MIFACGCTLAQKLAYGYTRRVVAGEDRCPEHDEPVQNWRSLLDREHDRINRHAAVESDAEETDKPVTLEQLAEAARGVLDAINDYVNPELEAALYVLDQLVRRVLP